jgi:hypothetical protein
MRAIRRQSSSNYRFSPSRASRAIPIREILSRASRDASRVPLAKFKP